MRRGISVAYLFLVMMEAWKLPKVLVIILILCSFSRAHGAGLSLNPNFPTDNLASQRSVVQVVGTLEGSGVLVLLDDQPVILTTSHIPQGASSVKVFIPGQVTEVWENQPEGLEFLNSETHGLSRVLMDFPRHDFSILSLPDSLTSDAAKLLPLLAQANGRICTGRLAGCSRGFHPGPQDVIFASESIGAVIDGKPTKFEPLDHWTSSLSSDQVISGDPSSKVWTIPLYSRPGISGGAFYHDGVLAGIATKVSYSGESEAYATSMDTIANVIAAGPSSENASWVTTPQGRVLQVRDGSDVIQVSPSGTGGLGSAGGEGGNGGGEGGNGGGHHDLYWKLSVSDDAGKHDATTLNPFAAKSSSLVINQRKVAYFEITSGLFGSPVKVLPTLALYLWYKHHDSGAMKVRYEDEGVLPLLEKDRASTNESFTLARDYVLLPDSDRYTLATFNDYNQQLDGSVALYPDQSGHWPKNPRLWGFPENPDPGGWSAELDSEGYYKPVNQDISAKPRSKDALLDVKIQSAFLVGITPDDYRTTKVRIASDLSQVTITSDIPGKPESKVILPHLPSRSVGSEIYGIPGSSCQATLIYDSNNLDHLERSFIELDHAILEFANCAPGKDCVR